MTLAEPERHRRGRENVPERRSPTPVWVACASEAFRTRAEALARRLVLPLAEPGEVPGNDAILLVVDEALRLELPGDPAFGSVSIDFVAGRHAHRRRFGGGRGEPLARAVGLKRGRTPSVVDATAGLGRDGFVLAALGCPMTLVERSPIVSVLLEDALERAGRDPGTAPIAGRINLVCEDAVRYLEALKGDERPDVVCLDPMYPRRTKSALVKQDMRVLRRLVGDDTDSHRLLAVALASARERVVVKRPAAAAALSGTAPAWVISSPNTRFDVYLPVGGGATGKS